MLWVGVSPWMCHTSHTWPCGLLIQFLFVSFLMYTFGRKMKRSFVHSLWTLAAHLISLQCQVSVGNASGQGTWAQRIVVPVTVLVPKTTEAILFLGQVLLWLLFKWSSVVTCDFMSHYFLWVMRHDFFGQVQTKPSNSGEVYNIFQGGNKFFCSQRVQKRIIIIFNIPKPTKRCCLICLEVFWYINILQKETLGVSRQVCFSRLIRCLSPSLQSSLWAMQGGFILSGAGQRSAA